jgi:hypothetical protein
MLVVVAELLEEDECVVLGSTLLWRPVTSKWLWLADQVGCIWRHLRETAPAVLSEGLLVLIDGERDFPGARRRILYQSRQGERKVVQGAPEIVNAVPGYESPLFEGRRFGELLQYKAEAEAVPPGVVEIRAPL